MSPKVFQAVVLGGCVVAVPTLAHAQAGDVVSAATPAQAGAQRTPTPREEADARQQRYQIGVLERVLEGAVEHGVTVVRDRLQMLAQMPADLIVSDNAHARGFRLEGYGVFFDISVPTFDATLWTWQTLDRNDLGFDSAIKELQALVKGNVSAEQALKRVELQVNPVTLTRPTQNRSLIVGARNATGSTASVGQDPPPSQADPLLTDPNEVYRTEVLQALKDAMLDHSSSLGIGPGEWLTIAARGNDDRPRLAPADSGARTRMIRLRGSDLAAYLARQISKDEALQRIEVKVF